MGWFMNWVETHKGYSCGGCGWESGGTVCELYLELVVRGNLLLI